MKKNGMFSRNKVRVSAVLAAAVLMMAGCGSSYNADTASKGYDAYNAPAAYTEEAMYDMAEDAYYDEGFTNSANTGDAQTPATQDTNRKLIRTASLGVETEHYDELMPAIEQQVNELGGYIEDMNSSTRNSYYDANYKGTRKVRYANMTIRIPKENLDRFLSMIGEQCNVISRSENVEDVTLQYVDMESHKKVLMTEQESLMELMKKAETVEDIITIESRLSQVRYEIESMESQLRTFDNKIDYSTVRLTIDEVEKYTPQEEDPTFVKIGKDFMESLEGALRGLFNIIVWFVVKLPYIVIWGIIIYIVYRIIKKKRMKRLAKSEGSSSNAVAQKSKKNLFGKKGKKITGTANDSKEEMVNQGDDTEDAEAETTENNQLDTDKEEK